MNLEINLCRHVGNYTKGLRHVIQRRKGNLFFEEVLPGNPEFSETYEEGQHGKSTEKRRV
ncbi:hypothetical protein SPACI_024210 [Sporomusa acidovorans DSM 3132]|uniref:Uncharacterized protein n=1 Tax=Sporomusa acidovorans (strain ATCC 49682 / DSM 3132 / Mol) TaxID=1123286 RepID=A0ABZ3J1Z3_SPOA4|nr:hypothetical protein SPACI_02410 [Sporomusa acidovorans DSM 3132]SDF68817.1 hypothetical protein SAMN04488499_10688 [Sporomusa acidovorans]